MRNTFMNTIMDHDDVFIVSGDAGLGVFDDFREGHADRFLNLGVAEQNAAGFCAGLALSGFKVCLYNIIPFVLYRCYEQVRNDICYQKLPVILAGIGSGVTYAPQGMTHYSVEDIGLARTLPNLRVFSPADPVEAKLAADYALENSVPVYVRLAKRGEPKLHKEKFFDISRPQIMKHGNDVAIVCHGSVCGEALLAREALAGFGITTRVITVPMLQPLNEEALLESLQGVRYVLSVEEHYVECGLGGIMQGIKVRRDPPWKFKGLGVHAGFIHTVRNQQGMRKQFGISAGEIAKSVTVLMEESNETVTQRRHAAA